MRQLNIQQNGSAISLRLHAYQNIRSSAIERLVAAIEGNPPSLLIQLSKIINTPLYGACIVEALAVYENLHGRSVSVEFEAGNAQPNYPAQFVELCKVLGTDVANRLANGASTSVDLSGYSPQELMRIQSPLSICKAMNPHCIDRLPSGFHLYEATQTANDQWCLNLQVAQPEPGNVNERSSIGSDASTVRKLSGGSSSSVETVVAVEDRDSQGNSAEGSLSRRSDARYDGAPLTHQSLSDSSTGTVIAEAECLSPQATNSTLDADGMGFRDEDVNMARWKHLLNKACKLPGWTGTLQSVFKKYVGGKNRVVIYQKIFLNGKRILLAHPFGRNLENLNIETGEKKALAHDGRHITLQLYQDTVYEPDEIAQTLLREYSEFIVSVQIERDLLLAKYAGKTLDDPTIHKKVTFSHFRGPLNALADIIENEVFIPDIKPANLTLMKTAATPAGEVKFIDVEGARYLPNSHGYFPFSYTLEYPPIDPELRKEPLDWEEIRSQVYTRRALNMHAAMVASLVEIFMGHLPLYGQLRESFVESFCDVCVRPEYVIFVFDLLCRPRTLAQTADARDLPKINKLFKTIN